MLRLGAREPCRVLLEIGDARAGLRGRHVEPGDQTSGQRRRFHEARRDAVEARQVVAIDASWLWGNLRQVGPRHDPTAAVFPDLESAAVATVVLPDELVG